MPKFDSVVLEQGSSTTNSSSSNRKSRVDSGVSVGSSGSNNGGGTDILLPLDSTETSRTSLESNDTVGSSTYDPLYAMEYKLTLPQQQQQQQQQSSTDTDPYATVKELVLKVFSRNSPLPHKYNLEISELKGGITNVLLRGVYSTGTSNATTSTTAATTFTSTSTSSSDSNPIQFLVRAYGNGTSAIIDRDREFATHLSLYSLSLAPPLYSRFANGLIYGFIPARATHYTELSDPEIMRGVSNKLAEWHVKLDRDIIETQMIETKRKAGILHPKFSKDFWEVLTKWVDSMPTDVVKVKKEDLKKELKWIRNTIGNVSPEVVSHCDLLCGNILIPETFHGKNGLPSLPLSSSSSGHYSPSQLVTFIDYEYAMPAPRGFDIANHFMEWQGFDCKTELIPEPSKSNPVLRYWAYHYLSALNHFSGSILKPTELEIDNLIQELVFWWGMPGFYWGVWSAIQSTISEIDFDYANYATSRLNEYYEWKEKLYPTLK